MADRRGRFERPTPWWKYAGWSWRDAILSLILIGVFGLVWIAVRPVAPLPTVYETGIGVRLRLISTKTEEVEHSWCGFGKQGIGPWTLRDVAPYWISDHEVTQAEFEHVMGTNPSATKGPQSPVDRVRWQEAVAFCEKLSDLDRKAGLLPKGKTYRVPTLREWFTAAQPWTSQRSATWNRETSGGVVHPGGKTSPDSRLLYDMLGNVSEWTAPDPSARQEWKDWGAANEEFLEFTLEALATQIAKQNQQRENAWARTLASRVRDRVPDENGIIEENLSPTEVLERIRNGLRHDGLGAQHPRLLALDTEIQRLETASPDADDLATYEGVRREYEIEGDIATTMREQFERCQDAFVRNLAVPSFSHQGIDPDFEDYLAVGGSVFDSPDDLQDCVASGKNEGRTPGVGFRFVMANE